MSDVFCRSYRPDAIKTVTLGLAPQARLRCCAPPALSEKIVTHCGYAALGAMQASHCASYRITKTR